MTTGLSERTTALLQQAGWSPTRQVDTGVYERALAAEGYPVHQRVKAFLSAYAPLRIFAPVEGSRTEAREILIDPLLAMEAVYVERVAEDYSPRVGQALCVVGQYHDGNVVLLMDAEGGVYGGYDETLLHLGETGEQALEAMCSGGSFSEVPELAEE